MAAQIWPVTDSFAAEVGDVDLSRPLSEEDWASIDAAYSKYSVLIFPDQHLGQGQHVDFARRFGPIDVSMVANMSDTEVRVPTDIADVSNLDGAGRVMKADNRMLEFQRGNRLWHTDSSFKPTPANASLLYIQQIPPVGGQTEFADMRAAYDALSATEQQWLEGKIALHSIAHSRKKMGFDMSAKENEAYPRVPQAMVRTHRQSGRRSLYIASHAGAILGLAQPEADARLERLMTHATQRQFVYTHRWRAHDLVIWDNRCALHRGRPFDDLRWPRDAQRATSLDIGNTCDQESLKPDAAA
jgi:alpha-ketoglutarate-dependent 2,4-dichlorophenoxyacetate dioxygenase